MLVIVQEIKFYWQESGKNPQIDTALLFVGVSKSYLFIR